MNEPVTPTASDGTLNELLLDLERDARHFAVALELRGTLPAGFAAEHYPFNARERRECARHRAAMALANGDPAVYVALARGRPVQRHRVKKALLDVHQRRQRV